MWYSVFKSIFFHIVTFNGLLKSYWLTLKLKILETTCFLNAKIWKTIRQYCNTLFGIFFLFASVFFFFFCPHCIIEILAKCVKKFLRYQNITKTNFKKSTLSLKKKKRLKSHFLFIKFRILKKILKWKSIKVVKGKKLFYRISP